MKRNRPEQFEDACQFDDAMRAQRLHDPVYLHRTAQPLRLVDLSTPQERGQLDMFDAECTGYCGV